MKTQSLQEAPNNILESMWPLILPSSNDVIYTCMHGAYGGRQRCFEASAECFCSVLEFIIEMKKTE